EAQTATGIVLRAREPPVLIGSQGRGLTMPPLDAGMLETFAAEALAPDDLERLRASGACDAVYRSERHGAFAVEARLNADKLSLKMLRSGAVLAKPVAPAPTGPRPSDARAPASDAGALPAPGRVDSTGASAAVSSRLAGSIARAVDGTVSDIIVSAGQPLWIRTANGLAASGETIDQQEILGFVDSLLDPPRRRCLETSGSVDLAWQAPAVDADGPQRLRVNVFKQAHGLALALRPVNRSAPTLAELNLSAAVGALGGLDGGMVLVVGTAGSGKSTTLAAIVELANRTRARHVITLEDPIEFVYQPQHCLIHQREIGTHVESFAAGLRAALRECPDIILVGEMRDRETVALALTAAETGHLVLSTLHSGSAPMAIDRIVDIFPEHQQAQIRLQVSGSLRAVVTQRLLEGVLPGTRYPALEILMVNYAVGALIREGKTHQLATQIQTGREDGMVALDASLLDLVRAGRISREVAVANARDPIELQRRVRS
ncbi:MAG TPA: PilT/PilU family type 4a pilus ATPase, partial [Polyangia bacterium]|nr:PilT/PilU family type 4a pilus ATPase [Polyangia bacterium]